MADMGLHVMGCLKDIKLQLRKSNANKINAHGTYCMHAPSHTFRIYEYATCETLPDIVTEFSSASALYESDESKLETVYNQLHNLSEYTDPKNYKSYDELKAKLMRVLGEEVDMGAPTVQQMNAVNDPAPMPEPVQAPVTAEEMNKQDDDDTMSYFAKLANEG